MLRKVGGGMDSSGAKVSIREANFPAPFQEGLEYSSPARGTWNIVHTGMLIPESHQIFVCAQGCLRGVVLTAAEMNAMGRYSAVAIREENVLDGTMEELMIEGVSDVLKKLSYRPKAVLLFISCQHFFLAYDQKGVFRTLRKRFPDIRFLDCYMIPTLRKSGLTPDQKMRIQLYSALEPMPQKLKKISLIGSNLPVSADSELVKLLQENGFELVQLQDCQSFDDYLHMAESSLNLFYEPLALMAAKDLEKRLGQKYLYLTFSFCYEELEENYRNLCEALQISIPDDWSVGLREKAELSLKRARDIIGDTPIAVDYSFTFRILSFTRMLLEHGFHVTEIYGDVFLPEEKEDFLWIQKHFPEIAVSSCIRPKMRYLNRKRDGKMLAVGQKAAYFTGTDHFVNVVESGGLYGYEGIVQIAGLMEDAFLHTKDRKSIIQRKGYGCESCI
ncbi:MAG: nitrogenase component 1 [Eubacteriales bacterium]|nr:nitrogenase component 1 [Eubacteriales bacterium]